MNNHKNPFCLQSAILLVGLCSCVLEENTDPIDELVEEVDVSNPVDISTAALGEQAGVGGINSNDAGTAQTSSEALKGDFNGDGYADLAIGVTNEEFDGVYSGAVAVLYGSDDGIDTEEDKVFHLDTGGIDGAPDDGDEFGYALAVGDFNDDGYADLAIGAPNDDVSGVDDAGSVTVLYGSDDGLDDDDSEYWNQGSNGIKDDLDKGDNFGFALTTGDFDDDGYDDLAIGVPYEDVGGDDDAGLVHVLYGTHDGLDEDGNQIWHQGSDNITGLLEDDDRFGSALAAGDFDDDGYDDLAIGVPGEDHEDEDDAGWVHVLYGSDEGDSEQSTPGSSTGLSSSGSDVWHQNRDGIEDSAEPDDEFGYALAVGDFDDDGYEDLAIGVPGEEVDSHEDAGGVSTIYGTNDGLKSSDDDFWTQDKSNIEGEADTDERFGEALAAGDFDDDGYDDLAIGAPGEDYESHEQAGQVQVLYGENDGLSSSDDQRWHQSKDDIEGKAEAHDHFGHALSAADFDGDGVCDLAIGVPFENVGSKEDAGAINIIYGDDSDGLTDEDNEYLHQDASGVNGAAEEDDLFGFALR